MRFEIFTLFPDFFASPLESSILKRAQVAGAVEVGVHDIREAATDKHHVCDDAPFGGGAGMVMKAEPVAKSVERVLEWEAGSGAPPCPIILLSPQGRTLNDRMVRELSEHSQLALLCAHYEGIDERAVEAVVTDEISVGDYVLTGGETAALVLMDAVARFVPGVLGNEESAHGDSFADGLLEAPHYTRPAIWREREVPEVLLSGDHARIERWRRKERLRRTIHRRLDLIHKRELSDDERLLMTEILAEDEARKREQGERDLSPKEI